jgi:hypothetical protein
MAALLRLNGSYPEWVRRGSGESLVLVGSDASATGQAVEVRFRRVVSYSIVDRFRDPVFRLPTHSDQAGLGGRIVLDRRTGRKRTKIGRPRRVVVLEAETPTEGRQTFVIQCAAVRVAPVGQA